MTQDVMEHVFHPSQVFREIARVLKSGGRLAVSDIALKKPLPEEIARDVMAYVGCIAGAVLIEEVFMHYNVAQPRGALNRRRG